MALRQMDGFRQGAEIAIVKPYLPMSCRMLAVAQVVQWLCTTSVALRDGDEGSKPAFWILMRTSLRSMLRSPVVVLVMRLVMQRIISIVCLIDANPGGRLWTGRAHVLRQVVSAWA